MFFQESTPDTSGYMIAGYTIAFLLMALYVASLYLRTRNLKQDMSTLEELDQPVQAAPEPAPRKPAKTPRRTVGSENNKTAKPVTKRTRKK